MAAAARLLTSLFQSSRVSLPAGAAAKPAQEVSRPQFIAALLKALSSLSV
jgi:hypothetical protein